MRRASTLVRLALALFALLAPAAPAVVRQVDAVAQAAAGPGPQGAPASPVCVAERRATVVVRSSAPLVGAAGFERVGGAGPSRRFLWHHAWLN